LDSLAEIVVPELENFVADWKIEVVDLYSLRFREVILRIERLIHRHSNALQRVVEGLNEGV